MGRDGDRRQIRRKNDAPAGRIQPYGTSPPERLQRARGGVSTALPLRSTRPVAAGGGISLRPSRRLDQSLAPEAARRDLHGIGVPERTPHSRTAPARPGRGLDFTSFRSTRPGGGGEEARPTKHSTPPPNPTSCRPEARRRRAEAETSPRTQHPRTDPTPLNDSSGPGEVSRLRCRSARHDLKRAEEAFPFDPRVVSTRASPQRRRGETSTASASPNGPRTPERLRHAQGGVSTSRRSARHDQGAGGGGTPHKTQHLPQTNTSSRLRFRYARHDLKRAGEGVSSSMRRR